MDATIAMPMTRDAQPLTGRSAIVTGGTTGIGRAIAQHLARQGVNVLICGRDQKKMDEALADMPDGKVSGVLVDLATAGGVETLFKTADKQFKSLDILVCNAALGAEPLAEVDADTIQAVVATNLTGYLLSTKQGLTRMLPKKAGHIVLIGSMSADVCAEGESLYAPTKAGIQALAESLRKETNEQGIRVSLIQPGAVSSEMQPSKSTHARQIKEQKMLEADDIAGAVLWVLMQPPRCDVVRIDVRPHLQMI